MTFKKALEILGLNEKFTRDDLKNRVRYLTKKYHPDLFANKSEQEKKMALEHQKEVSEAYAYLSKHMSTERTDGDSQEYEDNQEYQQQQYSQKSQNSNIYKYKQQVISALMRKLQMNTQFDLSKYTNLGFYGLHVLEDYIGVCISQISNLNTREEIYRKYQECLNGINKYLESIKDNYYKKNNIDESEVTINLNYDGTVSEFLDTLVAIKKQVYQVKYNNFLNTVAKETAKYESYPGYQEIYSTILELNFNAIQKAKAYGFRYNTLIIKELHKSILKHFNIYYALQKEIDEILLNKENVIYVRKSRLDTSVFSRKEIIMGKVLDYQRETGSIMLCGVGYYNNVTLEGYSIEDFKKEFKTLDSFLQKESFIGRERYDDAIFTDVVLFNNNQFSITIKDYSLKKMEFECLTLKPSIESCYLTRPRYSSYCYKVPSFTKNVFKNYIDRKITAYFEGKRLAEDDRKAGPDRYRRSVGERKYNGTGKQYSKGVNRYRVYSEK